MNLALETKPVILRLRRSMIKKLIDVPLLLSVIQVKLVDIDRHVGDSSPLISTFISFMPCSNKGKWTRGRGQSGGTTV